MANLRRMIDVLDLIFSIFYGCVIYLGTNQAFTRQFGNAGTIAVMVAVISMVGTSVMARAFGRTLANAAGEWLMAVLLFIIFVNLCIWDYYAIGVGVSLVPGQLSESNRQVLVISFFVFYGAVVYISMFLQKICLGERRKK